MRESTFLHSHFQSQFKFLTLTLPGSPSCCQNKQVKSTCNPVNPLPKTHCLQLFTYKVLNTIYFLPPSLVFLLITSLTVSVAETKRIFLSPVPFFVHSPTMFSPSSHLHLPLLCLEFYPGGNLSSLLSNGIRGSHLCFHVIVCPCPKALNVECHSDLVYLVSPHSIEIVKVSGKYVKKEVL